MIRILLVDGHPLIHLGFTTLLARHDDLVLVGNTTESTHALHFCEADRPDVVILALNISGEFPDAFVVSIRAQFPQIKVILLTSLMDESFIRGMVQQGVSGCILKSDSIEAIPVAIRTISAGGVWFSQTIIQMLVRPADEKTSFASRNNLTPRETDVLRWIVAGRTNKQIAKELRVSEKSVEKYVRTLFEKLDADSRVALAVRAIRESFE
ncbi:MAG: response regulator transcription factor [Chloroflexi bacterium]|nr:response regulator transcription factor [Chloroflexota bacterium]